MRNSDYIDLSLIDTEKLQDVLSYKAYFLNKEMEFYSVTKDKEHIYKYSDEINNFIKSLYEANILQPFNWVAWKDTRDAQYLLSNPDRVVDASIADCVKMLIVYLRSERFMAGQLREAIEDGFIASILNRFQETYRIAA